MLKMSAKTLFFLFFYYKILQYQKNVVSLHRNSKITQFRGAAQHHKHGTKTMAKRITRATLKSFIRKNIANLYTIEFSTFNGMIDCVDKGLQKLTKEKEYDFTQEYTLGLHNIWLCGHDGYEEYEYQGMKGIYIYNCCGSYAVLTK